MGKIGFSGKNHRKIPFPRFFPTVLGKMQTLAAATEPLEMQNSGNLGNLELSEIPRGMCVNAGAISL